jgi:hypothetical protein
MGAHLRVQAGHSEQGAAGAGSSFACYADNCNVYVGSKKAGEMAMI